MKITIDFENGVKREFYPSDIMIRALLDGYVMVIEIKHPSISEYCKILIREDIEHEREDNK